jgi:SHS2 domain-containing protein
VSATRRPPVPYEMLDHTADLGVEFSGRSLSDLFAMAGAVLADVMYDPDLVAELERREVRLKAETSEQLMVRWLNELIYHREVGEFLWRTVEVETLGETGLSATLGGEPFRQGRHDPRGGVKAATYHLLRISRAGSLWEARIIFDI